MTGSLIPRSDDAPQIRVQHSMRSLPTSASTVAPEDAARREQPPKRPARRKLWFFTALSVVAGVLCARALQSSDAPLRADIRSGSPGFKQSSTGKNIHWQKNAVTIYLDESLNRLGPGTREAVMEAFGNWVASDPNLPSISFDSGKTSTEPRQDGKSTVSFGRIAHQGHENDVAITITYSNDQTGEIMEADVILNSSYAMGVLKEHGSRGDDGNGNWKQRPSDAHADECGARYDAQNVATHEAGHFFGLGEDMIERQATMFLSISQCETHKRELKPTDVTAVKTLYAETASEEEKAAGPRACSVGLTPARDVGWGWVGALSLALALARRRSAR